MLKALLFDMDGFLIQKKLYSVHGIWREILSDTEILGSIFITRLE